MKKIEKIPNPKEFTLAPPRILNKQKSYANMIILYIFTVSLEIRKNLILDNLADYGHLQQIYKLVL